MNLVSLPVIIYVSSLVATPAPAVKNYIPRGRNELHKIFECHFVDFCKIYDERYAETYGMFRLERIQRLGERFAICGDYLQGIARIRCTNPDCGQDYFRPFSCKGFYFCPSCSRKRTLLFAGHLTEEVLLDLPRPHRFSDNSFSLFPRRSDRFSDVNRSNCAHSLSSFFKVRADLSRESGITAM
jgi:hypothetical protein